MFRLLRSSTFFKGLALAPLSAAAAFAASGDGAEAATAATNVFDHVSCSGANNEVRVSIEGVKESVGLMVADLYREDQDGFLKRDGRVQQVRFAARAPVTQFCMRAPVDGNYAMAVYHDENANKTLDRAAFGIPTEPFGISNNPVIRFGPPTLEESLFVVPEDGAVVEIKLKN